MEDYPPWSFRDEAAAVLRWGDLLNNAPTTLVLLKEGPIGLAPNAKTRGKSEGGHCGASNFAFPTEIGYQMDLAFSNKTLRPSPETFGLLSLFIWNLKWGSLINLLLLALR